MLAYTWDMPVEHGYLKSKCFCMVNLYAIFLNLQTNISKCLILWISHSQIFVSGISLGYLHSIPADYPATDACRLGSLVAPSDPGCHGLICCTLHYCNVLLPSRSRRQALSCASSSSILESKLLSVIVASCLDVFVGARRTKVVYEDTSLRSVASLKHG